MTFSIVAYDPESKEIGIGVHSKVFSVGAIVPWVQADVGAVATQSLVNVSLGPIGLQLLAEGRTPEQVLEHFREIDQGIELRQVGIVSVKGDVLSFTGDKCLTWAGGKVGENYTCQGNILVGPAVIDDMAAAFEQSSGTLLNRILAALEAAELAGGDQRGSQSVAIIIEKKGAGRAGYGDRKVDLRVEDHPNPILEMRRLVNIQNLYSVMQEALILSTENMDGAIELLERQLNGEKYREYDEGWLGLGRMYYLNGDNNRAKECIKTCLEIHPGMIAIIKEYPQLGLGLDDEFITEIISEMKIN